MKTAITVWGERVSPVFDSAKNLLIAEIENKTVVGRQVEGFDPDFPHRLTERLAALNIEVFLCGAISMIPARAIELSGIKLISFISGNVDEILQVYAAGMPVIPAFLMPGCKCRHRVRNQKTKISDPGFSQIRETLVMPRGNRQGVKGQGAGSGRFRKQMADIKKSNQRNE